MTNRSDPDIASLTAQTIACYQTGDFAGTQRHANSVLNAHAQRREKAICRQLLGLIAHRSGRFDVAVEHLKQAVELQPEVPELRKDLAETHTALARRLRKQTRLAEAEGQAREALRWQPHDPEVQNVLGVVLHEQNKLDEARQCFEQALQTAPRHPQLRLNYANLLCALLEFDAAIEEYRQALALRPDDVRTLLNAGAAFLEAKRRKPAIQLLERAKQLDGSNTDVHFNLGNAYVGDNQIAAAVQQYEHALRLQSPWPAARANWIRQRAEICDWRDDWRDQLQTLLGELSEELNAGRPSPLNVSQTPALPVPASIMRRIACRQTELLRRQQARRGDRSPLSAASGGGRRRRRIGYLSYDFRHHATGHLARSMFGHHDRDKFEVFTYSYGPDDGSDYRQRIQADSEHFLDLNGRSDTQIAAQITSDGIDILVDLHGYAKNGRPAVLLMRPAPVLVHYLGFPGTQGGLVDYFVTDPVLTPPGSQLRDEFSEALIYLPYTYQMTDDQQPITDHAFDRKECGLPAEGFVFAAFNNSYKIQPEIFDVWMRILSAVPDSVLWLLTTQPQIVENLRCEARRRSVEANRLVFADIASKPEHLARHRLADLFLDTTVCCAHTTATDSLWAGVPLITCPGQRFTERVAASLLSAAELQELIVGDLAEYEQLAIDLATHPQRCQDIRDDWSGRRTVSRLFDTAGRVHELERAFDAIWQRHCAGLPPQDIAVPTNNGHAVGQQNRDSRTPSD